MALAATIQWNLRTGGADTNGGGFKPGATGTDFSLQDAAQYALTGVTSAGAGNIVLTASAAADMVGNTLNVISGTNYTVGFFEITSVSVGVSITVSTNNAGTAICTGVGATGVMNIGGGLLTVAVVEAVARAGQIVNAKSGTYTFSAAVSLAAAGDATAGPIAYMGYQTTPGDGGTKPLFTTATNSTNLFASAGRARRRWRNISFSNTASTRGAGFATSASASGWSFEDCVFDGFTSAILGNNVAAFAHSGIISNCEVKNCTGFGLQWGGQIRGSWIHNNVGGVQFCCSANSLPTANAISDSLITGNTSHGIMAVASSSVAMTIAVTGCVIDGNTGTTDGINAVPADVAVLSVFNTIMSSNGRYGLNITSAFGNVTANYNGYYNNTSGKTNNLPSGQGANDVDVTAGTPYTNSGGNDWTLNNTASQGALLRATGNPGTIMNATGTGYEDIGAFQHQDSGGSGGNANILGGSVIQ